MEKYTFEPVTDKHTEEVKNNSVAPRQSNPELIVYPSKCVLTYKFKEDFEKIYNFEVYPDDTWVITFPKSGTTWTQEMVWLLKNNLDFDTAKSIHLRYRCPFMELESIISDNGGLEEVLDTIEPAAKQKRPRCIKSHLPVELLPRKLWTVRPKIVYVSRDPRDVAISYYHHYRLWNGYQGKLENFTEAFLADRHIYSPYWSHNLGFWTLEDKTNILFNNFEEMKVIRKTAKFLRVDITENDVEKLNQHLTFKNMKNNDKVNFLELAKEVKEQSKIVDDELVFFRKGESGGWANTYSKEMLEKFRKWTETQLAGTPYKEYPYSSK